VTWASRRGGMLHTFLLIMIVEEAHEKPARLAVRTKELRLLPFPVLEDGSNVTHVDQPLRDVRQCEKEGGIKAGCTYFTVSSRKPQSRNARGGTDAHG
jgi:hypothetical protein